MIARVRLGHYEILREIGRGGMGTVFLARGKRGEEVAVKVLLKSTDEAVARFDRERRLLAELRDEDGFVPILDAGLEGGSPYLVMPFVQGGTLRDRIEDGPLPVEAAVALGRTLALALARAHERGIVHRDLKPENILFDGDRPLVADLGLAKHFRKDVPGAQLTVSLSRPGELRGTAGYMAPEQLQDAKSVDAKADIFALGAVLYECLAGERAHAGETVLEIMASLVQGVHGHIRDVRPEVPESVASVVERAIVKDPAGRWPDARAFEAALGKALEASRGKPADAKGAASKGARALDGTSATVDAHAVTELDGKPAPRRSLVPILIAGLGVVAVALVIAIVVAARPRLPTGLRLVRTEGVAIYAWKLPGDAGEVELVRIAPGEFFTGSGLPGEEPVAVKTIAKPFWIGRHEVTWKEYLAFARATSRAEPRKPVYWDRLPEPRERHPVVNVAYEDARSFCIWAGLRLPTGDEWERAARGLDGRRYPWGDSWDPTRANHCDASCPLGYVPYDRPISELGWRSKANDGFPFTAPVGSFPAGASLDGALDMAGNVWEWCANRPDGVLGPKEVVSFRGGCFDYDPPQCRSNWAFSSSPLGTSAAVGFRVVLAP